MIDHLDNFKQAVLDQWNLGNALEAGRMIFEALPVYKRPVWATDILRVTLSLGMTSKDLEELLEMSKHPYSWKLGDKVFNRIRDSVLEISNEDRAYSESILLLGECVAKVMYNSANDLGEEPKFDIDSGWWIVQISHTLCTKCGDECFQKDMLNAIIDIE